MKYGVKYQRWYKALVHYPKRYRLYLTLLVLLSLVSLWQVVLYRPFNRAIQFYAAKNKNFKDMVQELNNVQQQTTTIAKNIQGLRQDLKGCQAQAQDVNDMVAAVVREAILNKLALMSCLTEPLQDQDWHQVQSMRIEVQGTLSDISLWLKKISDRSKLLSVPSIAIVQVDQAIVRCSATMQAMRVRDIA